MNANIRVGLIGTGPWSRNIVKTIAVMDGVELSYAMNQSGVRPDFIPKDVSVAAYRPALLDPDSIDAVVIATPAQNHADIAIAALQRRLAVFVEKPLTLGSRAAADISAQHRLYPAPFFVDHIYLFHAGFRALKSALSDNGPIKAITSVGGNWGPFRTDRSTLWDWAPHDIAMCLDLVGQMPKDVTCRPPEYGENGQGQRLEFTLEFSGPCQARINVGDIFPRRRRQITVYTETDTLCFDDEAEPRVLRYPAAVPFDPLPGSGADTKFSGDPPLTQALTEFSRAIRQNDNGASQLKLGAEVVEVIEMLDRKIQNRIWSP